MTPMTRHNLHELAIQDANSSTKERLQDTERLTENKSYGLHGVV